jgi:hypothetical protein
MVIRSNGCLLPLLIILNLFFGRIFFSLKLWLAIEGVLIALFIINSYIFTRQFFSVAKPVRKNVVDVQGEVVEERGNAPHIGKMD